MFVPRVIYFLITQTARPVSKPLHSPSPSMMDPALPHGSAIHLTLGATGIVKQSSRRLCKSSVGP